MTAQDKFFEHDGKRISYREAEVLLCCAKGMSIEQTANLLNISPATVKSHREHLRERFGTHGRNALCIMAVKLQPELEKSVNLP